MFDFSDDEGSVTDIEGELHLWTPGGWCPVDSEDHLDLTDGESCYTLIRLVEDLYEQNKELNEDLEHATRKIEELEAFGPIIPTPDDPLINRGWVPAYITPEALKHLQENPVPGITLNIEENHSFLYSEKN